MDYLRNLFFPRKKNQAPPPLILWDIDGPLNPFRASGLGEDERFLPLAGSWNSGLFDMVDYPRWASQLLSLGAEFIWVSNWAEEANLVAPILGLDAPIPFLILDDFGDKSWKLSSVRSWLASQPKRPVLWFDDELFEDAQEWAASTPEVTLLPADAVTGWTHEQFLTMKTWVIAQGQRGKV